ncbi:4-hydroxy-tetrahydrodipicolinate synthase [Salipiger pallidus]|uniref:4-hydroxy-tetrahydrodipicolinate synthase n=1 Tax=Salipiger pallidus TaxID=1775170 RepID=A0A8J2ZHW6_9RHOB|nr:4-hydroxy-tetrahydrodipicolinate synthase [Salipiger pallidus]GGG64944.1 4-hydroxy-tetrahydrodipicolinate synthase [Salipiger pallidus]
MSLTKQDLNGLFTAIITPFTKDGSAVDYDALKALVSYQIANGAAGVVPIGGTGEYPALSRAERAGVVSACVEAAEGRPVMPGVLSTGFHDAVDAGKDFSAAGAAGVMLVTPYYAPGTQDGMREYFRNYRDAVDLPVMAYEIPRRTGVAFKAETLAGMAEDGSIIGMKYSSYDMPEFISVMNLAGDKIAVLSGEEPLFATHVSLGATGGVLASANVYPAHWIKVFDAARSGDMATAVKLQHEMDLVLKNVFAETNPGPLKAYMEMVGMAAGPVRTPLSSPSAETMEGLKAALASVGAPEKAVA